MTVTFRPSAAGDLEQLTDRPLPHRIKAITAVLDGRVVGIGGIGFRPDGVVIAFAHLGDELRRHRLAVQRAGRAGMALIRASGVPMVIAEAQGDNPAAERWLRHFGFEPVACGGGTAFVWRRDAHDRR